MKRTYVSAIALAVGSTLALSSCAAPAETASDDTISIMVPFLEAQPPAANDTVQTELEEITGKKLELNWVPNSSYEDKTNITLAGDDLPDVMIIQGKSPGFVKNANAGAFWDLTDELEKYPNLTTEFPEVQQNSSVNGKVYGVYRARDAMRTAVILRKDWLTNLGLEAPTNTQELYEVAQAFTNDDPDGNGVADTYGLIVPKWPGTINTNSPYDVISTWYGAGNAWRDDDGELVPNFTTDEFLEANQYIKKFVDEGLINPDYATMDSATWNDPFFNGKGGIIVDVQSRAAVLTNLWKESDPENFQNFVEIAGNLEGPDGELYSHPTDGYSGFLAIPKAKVQTEEQLAEVLSFLNELNSEEAVVLINNGIEDVSFTLDGDLSVPADVNAADAEAKEVIQAIKSYAQLGMNVDGIKYYLPKMPTEYEQEMNEKRLAIQESDLETAVYNPAAAYVSETQVSKGAQLGNIVSDARVQYLAGQISEDELVAAVELWKTSGGNDVIAETNELFQADN
ncbi:MAG TPA: extracellular solute-binding protein [Glaciihabitans sp.]|nr:extracellular solute-binding protein [Glaciihabitans sp.]